ncbi:hypothetical protein AB1Y20_014152 [Prymnesium parvum]|uniref:Uncharacterized protein n=1 Tax=Prymnesium parvum TaxID=97485 RepID=A0AB34ICV6_PRYPA
MGNCASSRKPPRAPAPLVADGPALYAIYLRPRRLKRKPEVVAAMEFNRRWGGLHVALCSFARPPGQGEPSHPRPVDDALRALHEAGRPRTLASFRLTRESARLPLVTRSDAAMLQLPADHPGLRAMCKAAAAAGLRGARRADELHLAIGDAASADGVREALWACEHWELALARASGGEKGIRVTAFLEVKPLSWDAGRPAERPVGSAASRRSATSQSGRRYHVYSPSLPSEVHDD